MADAYFTKDNIKAKSQEMINIINSITNKSRKFELIPKNSALIVIDMQKYFLEKTCHAYLPSAEAIIPNIQRLIQAYKSKKLPIIFTKHTNTIQNARMMSKWWDDLIPPESQLSEISSEIDFSNCPVINKNQYDAFIETNLEPILIERKISQIVICGVMTNLCCETTARSAFMRGFEVLFLADGTATKNEYYHIASLLNLAYGFAHIVMTEDILRMANVSELKKKKIVFLCAENSCRSQIAEALALNLFKRDDLEFASMGTQPAMEVDKGALEILKEEGIFWDGKPKVLSYEQKPDIVVTMGCDVGCPVILGAQVIQWNIPDPKGKSIEEYRKVLNIIKEKLTELINKIGR